MLYNSTSVKKKVQEEYDSKCLSVIRINVGILEDFLFFGS